MTLDPAPSDDALLAMLERKRAPKLLTFNAPDPEPGAMPWPVRITLPWSHLVSDNRRNGVLNGRLLLTAEYRMAKGLIRDRARDALGTPPPTPVSYPLALEARVWVPDDTRAHDVANFAKATHDALETVVYTKDRYLYDVRWIRAGVCVDRPRAELTIRPLLNP